MGAALWGHEKVVKIVLEQEVVSPDKANGAGRTPLSFAAQEEGTAGVVEILLEQKQVNPGRPGSGGHKPLRFAAR